MKAARVEAPHASVMILEVEDPLPGPGQVVIRVTASGVCGSDLHVVDGKLGRTKYPLTLGHEPAGIVHQIGEGVSRFREGDRVLLYPTTGCGTCMFCIGGKENLCPAARSYGFEFDGTDAEFALVPSERYLYPLRRLSDAEAAPLACAGVTAYHAIKNHVVGLAAPGDSVVVVGAGGLGHLAVQMLRALSPAHVMVVDTREEKLELAKSLGAEDIMSPSEFGRLTDAARKSRVAAVIDTVGSDQTLSLGFDTLGTGGRLVVLGAAGGSLNYSGPDAKDRMVAGPILGSLTEMRETLELAEQGLVRVVHRDFPLEKVNEVLAMVRGGQVTGRAVLIP